MKWRDILTGLVVLGASACETSSVTTVKGAKVELSAQQTATITRRLEQLAAANPDLYSLIDSISIVIRTGAEVDSVGLMTDLGSGPFYAIGLQRAISTASSSSATFDAILFNNPSDPTDFIIVDGWIRASSTQPPQTVSGSIGGATTTSSITAHLFHIEGGAVNAWTAKTGLAWFQRGAGTALCPGFNAPSGVTCSLTGLNASFTIGTAERVSGPATAPQFRMASLEALELPGILLKFQIP